MQVNIRKRVDQILTDGYQIDLGKVISEGMDLFKRDMGSYVGFGLIATFIYITLVCFLIGPILLPILIMGFSYYSYKLKRHEFMSFSDFFFPFNKFGNLLGYSLLFILGGIILYIPSFIHDFPMYVELFQNLDNVENIIEISQKYNKDINWVNLVMLPFQMIFYAVMFYAPYLILYGDYGVIESISTSFRLAFKNFGMLLLVLIIATLASVFGIIACCIGIFLTLPIGFCIEHALVENTFLNEQEIIFANE